MKRLEISDVNGIVDNSEATKNNGGLIFEIAGTAKETWFDSLLVEDCYIHDVDRTGIANLSTWENRTLTGSTNWIPSKNMIYRGNIFERTGANALIVRVAEHPVMEHNLFNQCAVKGTGNACFNFNTEGAVWQYNEACYTKYNAGDEDAGGFDSDFKSTNTLIQYNYSHDNEWGAVLLTGGPTSSGGFNDGTVIRYNLFVNNKHHEIKTSGHATNSVIYNNSVYNRPSMTGILIVYHKSWDGYSVNTSYYNNIFNVTGTAANVDLGGSAGNVFDYNVFYGTINNEPADAHKLKLNPMFVAADSTGFGSDSITGYRLKGVSPVINTGMMVPGAPLHDIEGTTIPMYDLPDRGAFEYSGPYGISDPALQSGFRVFPNPAPGDVTVTLDHAATAPWEVSLFSTDGKILLVKDFPGGAVSGHIALSALGLKHDYYLLKLSSEGGVHGEVMLLTGK